MLPKGGEVALDGRQTPRYGTVSHRVDVNDVARAAAGRRRLDALCASRKRQGIESVLISFSRTNRSIVVACALGQTEENSSSSSRIARV